MLLLKPPLDYQTASWQSPARAAQPERELSLVPHVLFFVYDTLKVSRFFFQNMTQSRGESSGFSREWAKRLRDLLE